MSDGSLQQDLSENNGDIDLLEILSVFWQEKSTIIFITAVFAISSVIYSLLQTEIYRSETLLAPAEIGAPSNPMLAQLSSVVGLAGINVNNDLNVQISTAIATMQSREFIRQFIHRHNLMPALMASSWDRVASANVINENVYNESTSTWIDKAPTDQEAYMVLRSILFVSESRETSLINVAIEWPDPVQAKNWLEWLVVDINNQFKQQDLQEASSAITYLQSQLQTTQLVEMQRAFYELIETQTRIVMLTDVRDEYVFRVVDPAFVPEQRIRPQRAMICIIGTFLGGIIALGIVLVRHSVRSRNEAATDSLAKIENL
jgi:LPS O-antigen subunit length determinant protein (WzzB/FepE family)